MINYFKFDNAVQNVLGDNDRIKELLNDSVDVHEKIEKLFCLTFNLDNVGYFDENLYFELKEFVGELSESMQGIEKEMAAGVSVGVSSSADPLVVKNSKAILALVCFYIELYALPDKLEDLKDASKSEIKDFVERLSSMYTILDGVLEEDFLELRYQFVFDYETDAFWIKVKEVYKKAGRYKTRYGYNDHPFCLFDKDNDIAKAALAIQITNYLRGVNNGEDSAKETT